MSTSKAKKVAVEDDYENEEFEAYVDDFEDDPKPVSKPSIPTTKSSSSSGQVNKSNNHDMKNSGSNNHAMNDIITSLANENSAAMEGKLADKRLNEADMKKPEMKLSAKTAAKVAASSIDDDNVPDSSRRVEKKYQGSSILSVEGSLALDPRYRRLTKLIASGVLDLQEEKFMHANILPTSKYDLYNRQIRSQNPTIHQIGVPLDLETRDIEVATDELIYTDKEMQFCFGDDTTMLNIMTAVTEAKHKDHQGKKSRVQEVLLQDKIHKKSSRGMDDSFEVMSGRGSQLLDYLQKSSSVMVRLIEESSDFYSHHSSSNSNAKTSSSSSSRVSALANSIFIEDSTWQTLGNTIGDGGNELIRGRATVVARHSELQPFLLLTAHPPPIHDTAEDLRPFKSLYAIWEINNPAAPTFILEAQGNPTCATFSRSQTYIIIAGTAEGCLYMWDLRESASHHKDRDAIDLRIERGIRKPCYSTHFMLDDDILWHGSKGKRGSHDDMDGGNVRCHSLPIVQVESLGDMADASASTSAVSQFISLDVSGLVVLWITSNDNDIAADPGMSPWSQVKLVPSRTLNTLSSIPSSLPQYISTSSLDRASKSASIESHISNHHLQQHFATSLATLPNDISSFMVAAFDQVHRVSRFGDPPQPKLFDRLEDKTCNLSFAGTSPKKGQTSSTSLDDEVLYKGFITSLCTSSLHHVTSMKSCIAGPSNTIELMLVGRSDGGVDLFRLIHSHPICSWNITDYEKSSSNTKQSKGVAMPRNASVVTVKWCPSRVSAFIVIDNHGSIYFFDLLENFDAPIAMDSMGVNISSQSLAVESYLASSSPLNSASPKGPAYPTLIDISQCRSGSRTANIAVVDKPSKPTKSSKDSPLPACNVKIRRMREEAFKADDNEESKFAQLLHERIRMNDNTIVAHVIDPSTRK